MPKENDLRGIVYYIMGLIQVGTNINGNLAVAINGREVLQQYGLLDQFDRAAAAFLKEFSKGETLSQPVFRRGEMEVSPEIEAVSDELELEMAASQMEVSTAADAAQPEE